MNQEIKPLSLAEAMDRRLTHQTCQVCKQFVRIASMQTVDRIFDKALACKDCAAKIEARKAALKARIAGIEAALEYVPENEPIPYDVTEWIIPDSEKVADADLVFGN